MTVPKFDLKELEVVKEVPSMPGLPPTKIYNTPVSTKEAFQSMVKGEAIWQMAGSVDNRIFTPRILPDNVARAFVLEATPFDNPGKGGGPDMFGIEWEYIPAAQGSMVRPDEPFLRDANEWFDKIQFPDIDSWDWEGSAKENNGTYLTADTMNIVWFQTGFYERLISFMEFEAAIMALVDEDQVDAVAALFDRLADLYIQIFDKFITHFEHIDGFFFHDDWGAQKETFFSPKVVKSLLVPPMKKVTDFLHSKGMFCELHSCGQLMKQVPNIIAAGWDAWGPQMMNDIEEMYEKYGDKIILGTWPVGYDPVNASEEEQRAAAKKYANTFCQPGKASYLNFYAANTLSPAFREELYKQSRINYSS